MRRKISIDWQTASKHLFTQPLKFFECIRGYPFTRGLPKGEELQDNATASVFKRAIACNGIFESSMRNENEELQNALRKIWRNGWLHAENTINDVRFVFASQIHHW